MQHYASKASIALAGLGIAALALTGCGGSATEEAAPATTDEAVSVDSSDINDAPSTESSFADMVLTTPDLTIEITDVKTIPAGETGNEYGDEPVIAFWYDTTNLTDDDITPSNWLFLFTAIQDNDPNAVNELQVAALPDDEFLESQMQTIKEGGTVSSAVAYELTDTTTPVQLVASDDLGMTEIGSMTFNLD